MDGPTIIGKRKRVGKVFASYISMVKKYKLISDSDGYSDINSSGSAEVKAEDTLPENRGRNTGQCHERRQFKQRTSFIAYTKSTNSIWRSIHILKVRRICGICDGVGESSVALQFFETLRTKIYLMFLISYICKSAIKKQSIFPELD